MNTPTPTVTNAHGEAQPPPPCSSSCAKCGSGDIYRRYYAAGTDTNGRSPKRDLKTTEWVDRSDAWVHPAMKDCIVHVCRCCGYQWDSDPLPNAEVRGGGTPSSVPNCSVCRYWKQEGRDLRVGKCVEAEARAWKVVPTAIVQIQSSYIYSHSGENCPCFEPNDKVRGGETPSSVPLGSAYRLVCAAMLMDDGLVVPGVRHFSPDMRAVLHRIYGEGYHLKVKEQGFIDTHGNFLDRTTAWQRCEETQQFHRKVSTDGTLYSENLY